MPTIKTVALASGEKRYEFTVDEPRGPSALAGLLTQDRWDDMIAALDDAAKYRAGTGDADRASWYSQMASGIQAARERDSAKRKQITRRFAKKSDAVAELARITHQTRTGEYVARSRVTVNEVIDRYLQKTAFEREENTRLSYRGALKPARERLGLRPAQSVDRQDIERLRDDMLASGRHRGGQPGTPLSARSVRLTLARLSAAFGLAIKDRLLESNPVEHVEQPRQVKSKRVTWSAAEARTFLAAVADDRLHAAWRLSLYGLRRGEVCGLRWDDVDLDAGTVTIGRSRVLVASQVVEKAPKSENGYRTLPLDNDLATALRALRRTQREEKLAAGSAYEDSGYVVADELGRPVNPDWYSDEFHRVAARAGLPRIRLHDSRHTINSLLAAAGVPPHIRAAWCGHTTVVNETTYTHARPEDLVQAAAALSKINNAV